MCVTKGGEVLDAYKGRLSVILGVLAIILQIIAVALNIAAIFILDAASPYRVYVPNVFTLASAAMWTALPIILFGAFAICSGRSKQRCQIITHLILAIIACFFAVLFVIFCIGSLVYDAAAIDDEDYLRSYIIGAIVVNVFLFLISLAQLIFAIICAVICCQVLCCGEKKPHENTIIFESAIVADNNEKLME